MLTSVAKQGDNTFKYGPSGKKTVPQQKPYVKNPEDTQKKRGQCEREKGMKRLAWFVEQGIIVPAPKCRPSQYDPSGYHYLRDLKTDNSPYTILIGVYKKDVRYFVIGQESRDSYVLVNIPSGEIFTSPTSASSKYIEMYQATDPVKNKSRMSGFEYLRFPSIKFTWMENPETSMTLKKAKTLIDSHIQPPLPAIRKPEDLYQESFPQDLDDINQTTLLEYVPLEAQEEPKDTKLQYPYPSFPSSDQAKQCSEYLALPIQFRLSNRLKYVPDSNACIDPVDGTCTIEIPEEQLNKLLHILKSEENTEPELSYSDIDIGESSNGTDIHESLLDLANNLGNQSTNN